MTHIYFSSDIGGPIYCHAHCLKCSLSSTCEKTDHDFHSIKRLNLNLGTPF